MHGLGGKIRDSDCKPINGLQILVYTDNYEFLGGDKTDSAGRFDVPFEHDFKGIPMVYVIDRYNLKLRIRLEDILEQRHSDPVLRGILKKKLESEYDIKEIEYQIMIDDKGKHKTAADGSDIYAENVGRMIMLLEEVGETMELEYAVSLDHLGIKGLSSNVVGAIQTSIKEHEEWRKNFLDLWRRMMSLLEAYIHLQAARVAAEWGVILYNYDGPQVPERPRSKVHDDVIMWPREKI